MVNPEKNKRRTFDQTNGLTLSLTVSPWKLSRLEAAPASRPPVSPQWDLFFSARHFPPNPVPWCHGVVGWLVPPFASIPAAQVCPLFLADASGGLRTDIEFDSDCSTINIRVCVICVCVYVCVLVYRSLYVYVCSVTEEHTNVRLTSKPTNQRIRTTMRPRDRQRSTLAGNTWSFITNIPFSERSEKRADTPARLRRTGGGV